MFCLLFFMRMEYMWPGFGVFRRGDQHPSWVFIIGLLDHCFFHFNFLVLSG
jgi:hypothetical protein